MMDSILLLKSKHIHPDLLLSGIKRRSFEGGFKELYEKGGELGFQEMSRKKYIYRIR
jgi:hypothetical protein